MRSADQRLWLERLERDHDNLRSAFDHLIKADPARALRLSGALGFFWEIRAHFSEGRDRLRRALGSTARVGATAANATYFAARLAFLRGEARNSEPLFREAVRLAREAGEIRVEVNAMSHVGWVAQARGDSARAVELHEEALAIARAGTDDWTLRMAMNNLGSILVEAGDTDRGRTLLEEALERSRRLAEPRGTALTAGNLAELTLALGDLQAGELLVSESLQSAREIDYGSVIGWALTLGALLALHRGDLDTADARMNEALATLRAAYDVQSGPIALAAAATLAAARNQPLLAAKLWAAVERESNTHGIEETWFITRLRNEWLPRARASANTAAWQTAWEAGKQLLPEQALELASQDVSYA